MFTSAVFATKIWKPPHVAQSDCITHARQEKIKFPSPRFSDWQLLFLIFGLDVQRLGLVIIGGHLVQFRHLAIRFGAVGRHVSGFGTGPGSRTGGFSTGPRRQQLRGFRTKSLERACRGKEARVYTESSVAVNLQVWEIEQLVPFFRRPESAHHEANTPCAHFAPRSFTPRLGGENPPH